MKEGQRPFRVITTKEAKEDLRELRQYIESHSTQRTATRYLSRLKGFAAELSLAPVRGLSVGHIRPGMRKLGFERRVDIVFVVFEEQQTVEIQGFDYGGRKRW